MMKPVLYSKQTLEYVFVIKLFDLLHIRRLCVKLMHVRLFVLICFLIYGPYFRRKMLAQGGNHKVTNLYLGLLECYSPVFQNEHVHEGVHNVRQNSYR